MNRYPPSMVVLHWLLAIVVLFLLLLGGDIALKIHLLLGLSVGGLFLIRFSIKLYTQKLLSADKKSLIFRLSNAAHNIIYGLVFAVVSSGVGVAVEAELLEVIRSGSSLPENYSDLVIVDIHDALTDILLVVVSIHIMAAFFHQFIFEDAPFSRMWFGRRS